MTDLATFIEEHQVGIPKSTLDRYINDYQHKDEWWNSSKAFDTWFKKYYNQYGAFTKGMKRELLEGGDYNPVENVVSPAGLAEILDHPAGRPQRQEYLISYAGLCQLEMKCDKKTRAYYIQLQKLIDNYIDHRRNKEHEEREALKLKILELEAPRPASIYKFFSGDKLLYIGKDKSKLQNRPAQHLSVRSKLILNNYQRIDLHLATLGVDQFYYQVQECGSDEVDQLEKELIEELQPEMNQAYSQKKWVCKCPIEYSKFGAYETHMKRYHS